MITTERKPQEATKQHNPDICPRCGASRSQLRTGISELPYRPYNPFGPAFNRGPFETENHFNARILMSNCRECKEAVETWQVTMAAAEAHGMHIK
jgi:hypothetical protein